MTVAALYVDTALGPYARMDGVECWGWATRNGSQHDLFAPTRDALAYNGPHPVVAHPPCGPWGRFWWNYKGGEGAKSAGPRAVEQVRAFGGVLEHPSQSGLWKHCGLPKPGDTADSWGGFTIEVNQCDWGHKARKPTWLYIVGGPVPPMPLPREPTHVMVRLLRNGNDWPEVPKRERHITPPAFAKWLVDLARCCVRDGDRVRCELPPDVRGWHHPRGGAWLGEVFGLNGDLVDVIDSDGNIEPVPHLWVSRE